MQLLQALAQMMKGGGQGGPGGTCACPGPFQGHPMANLTSLGGGASSGAYDMLLNPGAGQWVGDVGAMGGTCGMSYNPKTGCQAPQMTTMGVPFRGIIPPSPTYKWQN
jgi:hypothetical protein